MNNQVNMADLAGVDIATVKKEDLVDVSGLTLDTSIPMEHRAAQILRTHTNPYCFRFGDIGVKLEFADSVRPLQNAFGELLERKRGGL